VLDFTYAATRALLHASRVATDMVDFTTSEFGFAELDGEIACGSSMMPQKRNPDVFELIRGRSGRAVANLMGLCTVIKGLPGGYNRDLQEDRRAVLDTGPLLVSVLQMLRTGLSRVRFRDERMHAAVAGDYLQATDLAEVLVARGIPFRTAYKQVGRLVRRCQELALPLGQLTAELARPVVPELPAEVLAALVAALDPFGAPRRKQSPGGTGPGPVAEQIEQVAQLASRARAEAAAVPRLNDLFARLRQTPL
jgi:argininosuccinate lyase